MSWRRGKAYAHDLRDRVLAATGLLREVAQRFGVSEAYVSRVRSRHERLGQASAGAPHNHAGTVKVVAALQPRSQPYRASICQAQGLAAHHSGAHAGDALERHRLTAGALYPR